MRALALLLIILNLGYFAWAVWIDAPPAPPENAGDDLSGVPRLMLASERVPAANEPTPMRLAAVKPEAKSQAIPETVRCVSFGPFQDLPTVTQASAAIASAGFDPRQRLEQGEVWVGHWVSIPGFATHEQAQAAVARLKEKGVNDAYILPGADAANVISLGVFKDHARAQRRFNEAKSLGLPVAMTDRTRAGSVYWVDVDLKDGRSAPDPLSLAAQPGKISRIEMRSCPTSN